MCVAGAVRQVDQVSLRPTTGLHQEDPVLECFCRRPVRGGHEGAASEQDAIENEAIEARGRVPTPAPALKIEDPLKQNLL